MAKHETRADSLTTHDEPPTPVQTKPQLDAFAGDNPNEPESSNPKQSLKAASPDDRGYEHADYETRGTHRG